MSGKLRVLCVGLGNMGMSHAKAYTRIDGYEVAALCERRIAERKLGSALGRGQNDRLGLECCIRNLAGAADDLGAVAAIEGVETPRADAMDARLEDERAGDDIFGGVAPGLVGRKALGDADRAKQIIQKVEHMRSQIDKQAAAGDLGNNPPGQRLRIAFEAAASGASA